MSDSKDFEKSLGDERTRNHDPIARPVEEQSLGDQSTFGGAQSSLSDLASKPLAIPDYERTDLSQRYLIEHRLGKGGMGEVLLATDTRLDRKVAIKRILGDAAKSQTAVSRFLIEAKSIAALNHFNIVQVYDYGHDKEGPYLIMEYVDGPSLQDRLRSAAIDSVSAVDIICQLCDGLSKAHQAGIIHRDIKPANILLTSDGNPKLMDFGLAKQESADHGQTVSGAVLGTLDYMPPEQRRDSSKVDARSDLWSLAATLYVMLTGRSPKVIRVDQVPESLRAVMAQALEENPEERFSSAQEFKGALLKAKRALATNVAVGKKLETGECPKCGAHNELSNKFCTSCTASLQQPCLNCRHIIRAWNAICPECGSRQSEALLSKQEILDQGLMLARSLEGEYRFDEAMKTLQDLDRIQHPELLRQYQAIDETQERISQLKDQWATKGKAALGEATRLCEQSKWGEALRLLRQIPRPLQTKEMENEASRTESRIAEINRLATTIKKHLASKNYEPLQPLLTELIALNPGDKQAKVMLQKLLERRGKVVATPAPPSKPELQTKLVETEAKFIYRHVGPLSDEDRGPVTGSTLVSLFASGTIKPESLVRNVTSQQWVPFSSLGELYAEGRKKRQQLANAKSASSKSRREAQSRITAAERPLTPGEARAKLERDFTQVLKELEGWFLLDVQNSRKSMTEWARSFGIADLKLQELIDGAGGLNPRFVEAMVCSASLRRMLAGMFLMVRQTKVTTDENRVLGQAAGVALTVINPLLGLGLLAASSLGSESVEKVNWSAFHVVNSLMWRMSQFLCQVTPGVAKGLDLGKPEGLLEFGRRFLQSRDVFGGARDETWVLDEPIVYAAIRNANNSSQDTETGRRLLDAYVNAHREVLNKISIGPESMTIEIERAFATSMSNLKRRAFAED